jgi:hypothetical protein
MADVETGTPTVWDNAWREGHAHGLANGLGISYREGYLRTVAMLRGEPLPAASTQAQNSRGDWVPAIPLPLFTWPHRHRCECGRSFWTMGGYRGHYALVHVMHLDTATGT